jgi:hypothetical protein
MLSPWLRRVKARAKMPGIERGTERFAVDCLPPMSKRVLSIQEMAA